MAARKQRYHALCEEEEEIPVFSRDWWLDAACTPARWDVILIEENGKIKAALPIYTPMERVISMPCYTQSMGPWLSCDSKFLKYNTLLSRRQALMGQMIGPLRHYHCFLQNFSPEITDWLPFSWAGYQETTRYTYRLDHLSDTDALLSGMSENMRRNIRKAKQTITVRREVSEEDFMRLHRATFTRQHLRDRQDPNVLLRLIREARRRGQGDIWGGYDSDGHLHAAAFIVWQKSCAWYLAGGGDPKSRATAAQSIVLWEAIQELKDQCRQFDFEGSMLRGVERFFREFGAKQYPYFHITKGRLSLPKRIIIKLKRIL